MGKGLVRLASSGDGGVIELEMGILGLGRIQSICQMMNLVYNGGLVDLVRELGRHGPWFGEVSIVHQPY